MISFKKPEYQYFTSFIFWMLTHFCLGSTTNNTLLTKDSIRSLIEQSEKFRFTKPEQGLKLAKEALVLCYKIADTSMMVKSANKLAILEKENSINTSALGTIIKSLAWANDLKNDTLIANSQLVAGHIYSNLGNYKEATANYKSCLDFFKSINDSSGISYTYSGLGIVNYDNKKFDEALNNYLNAEIYWVDEQASLKADLWNNIGALYVEKNEFDNARYYYNKALSFYKSEKWWSEISMVYYNLGELFLKENNITEATNSFNNSLKIGEEIESYTEIIWAYYGLYLTHKKAKNLKEALSYFELYTNLKDSIHGIQNKEEVRELEALFHQEKQLKKIKDQQLKIVQTEKRVQNEKLKNLIFIVIIIFILLLLLLGIYHFRKSKKQNKTLKEQQQLVSNSLEEKELLLKEIHHRVKNNLQVISSLLNLQNNAIDNPQTKYVINETQNRINAIALVHKKLYQSQNIGKINFSSYLQEIVDQQKVIYNNQDFEVDCIVNTPKTTELNLDIAVSLGLIVSELITNAFKYAFHSEQKNKLEITLIAKEKGKHELIVSDNGPGLPKEFENGEKESLGMELVKILTEQIEGKITIKNDNGAFFFIEF